MAGCGSRSTARRACATTPRRSRPPTRLDGCRWPSPSWVPRPARRRFSTPAPACWAEARSPAPPDLVAFAFHWLELLGLLGGIGSLVVRRLSRMPPRIGWVEPPMHIAFAAALAGGAGLLVLSPSVLLLARVGAEGIALLLCLRGIPMVAVFAVLAAGLLPLTEHASTQPQAAGAEFADIIHVLSAAMWGGGILALASLRPPEGWRSADARAVVGRFERVAQVAFAVTALTGVLRATEQLQDVNY